MTQSLSERADVARDALFNRYDELNALWTQAEEELTRFHIPTGVKYVYLKWHAGGNDYEPPDPYQSYKLLGLQKLNGKWRICHGYDDDLHCDDDIVWTPITECSAEIRISVARYLPNLREAVVKSAEDFIPKVEKGIQALKDALNECRRDGLSELLAERAKLNGKAK